MNISKLNPIKVGLLDPKLKGSQTPIVIDKPVWVCKNVSGEYHGIYSVIPKSDMVFESPYCYGFLALVPSSVDVYFTSVNDMDIIGETKEEVENTVQTILGKQKEDAKARNKFFKNFKL